MREWPPVPLDLTQDCLFPSHTLSSLNTMAISLTFVFPLKEIETVSVFIDLRSAVSLWESGERIRLFLHVHCSITQVLNSFEAQREGGRRGGQGRGWRVDGSH